MRIWSQVLVLSCVGSIALASGPDRSACARPFGTDIPEAEKARVARLVQQLGHPLFEEREAAHAEILGLRSCWRPFLQEARWKAEDAEIQARLSEILEQVGQPRWKEDLAAALAEAQAGPKPLLVLCADCGLDESTTEAERVRKEMFSDPAVIDDLNERFVLVWHKGRPALLTGAAPSGVMLFFCSPDGGVRHALAGFLPAELFRSEIRRSSDLFCQVRNADLAAIERKVAEKKLLAEAQELERGLNAVPGAVQREARERIEALRSLAGAYRRIGPFVGKPVREVLEAQARFRLG